MRTMGIWRFWCFPQEISKEETRQKNQRNTSFLEVLIQSQGMSAEQEFQGLHSLLVTQFIYASWTKNQETAAVNLPLNNWKASVQISKDITYSKILSQPLLRTGLVARGSIFGSATQLLFAHEEVSSSVHICEMRNVSFTSFPQ